MHTVKCKVYVTVASPSVRPSVCLRRSSAAATCGGFAACGQQTSIDDCRRRVLAVDRYLLRAPELRLRVASC